VVRLPGKKVLALGGSDDFGSLKYAEVFSEKTGRWTRVNDLRHDREAPLAVPLPNGAVLVAGGATKGTARRSSEVFTPAWDTSGPSFGVDLVPWAATAKGALALLDALPDRLGGKPRHVHFSPADEEFGAQAIADYPDVASLSVTDEYITTDTASGKPEPASARDLLAASFGLQFGCLKASYRGTIKARDGGIGPGTTKESPKGMWFSCAIAGAEGDENFSGHAVGWISKKAAWLLIAKDENMTRSLITHLRG
jgi:hypothetical protein